jgi:exopolyphosphatase / guanosine-5'-triphosphate,3'-diphosphate pyrophosphatase
LSFPEASPADLAAIEDMLGRPLAGRCRVLVRRRGTPAVIENEPHLRDGTPMPTLYWLVDPHVHEAVSRLESEGGVHRFEDLVDPAALADAHESYARRRASRVQRHDLVAPSGGVGGTRQGVKCLHAHLANFLAGYRDPVGELVAGLVDVSDCERVDEVLAALDCGSNSTRLLIADSLGAVRREARITRLSEGVDASATLTDAAIARTYAVLEEYRTMMDDEGVRRGLLVATSAVRDATNGAAFIEGARDVVGVDVAILTGAQEAAYSFAGASADLALDARATLVLDVGGGSTELVLDTGGSLASFSMQLGCVRVTERALGPGVVTPESEGAARAMIDAELERAFGAVPAFATTSPVRLVGLAGTVATLVQLDGELEEYDHDRVHHQVISRACVRAWRERLGAETPTERLAHPGMVSGREDVLVAGLFVIEAVMERFGAEELLSSESDILDGIVSSLRGGREGPRPDTMEG